MGSCEDLTGRNFGKLTVIRYLMPEERPRPWLKWLCKCECDNMVSVAPDKLLTNHTRSCGCLVKQHIGNVNRKYKYTNKRLYGVYKAMLDRCYNPKSREYHNYGGRGIEVYEAWKDSYDAFAEWALANGYNPKAKHLECTLDRADVDKGYIPDNCRWVSNQVQQNNRRDCMYAEYNGEVHTCMEWSKILGMTYNKVHYHLKMGRTIEYILSV